MVPGQTPVRIPGDGSRGWTHLGVICRSLVLPWSSPGRPLILPWSSPGRPLVLPWSSPGSPLSWSGQVFMVSLRCRVHLAVGAGLYHRRAPGVLKLASMVLCASSAVSLMFMRSRLSPPYLPVSQLPVSLLPVSQLPVSLSQLTFT